MVSQRSMSARDALRPSNPPAGRLLDTLPAERVARLWARANGERRGASRDAFERALERSARHRFGEQAPPASALEAYFDTLHLDDFALAAACAVGDETAWAVFVNDYRPLVYRSARAIVREDTARELADSIYADLFGLVEKDGRRQSLFEYFHGRSTLSTWLHAVLARRHVDRVRAARHELPLDEDEEPPASGSPRPPEPPDPDRARLAAAFDEALGDALAGLETRDRLRLALYYTRQMKLAAVGRVLGEHEATVSRKLERTRRAVREHVERRLAETAGLGPAEVAACFEIALDERPFDLETILAPEGPAG